MTLSEVQANLAIAKTAYAEALKGKSYTFTMDGVTRTVSRQDLNVLRDAIQYWEKEESRLQTGTNGIPTKFITPVI